MGIFSSLFGRKEENERIRAFVKSLTDGAEAICQGVRNSAYPDQEVIRISVLTLPEVFAALLHYISRVALHVGGAVFQGAFYAINKKLLIEFQTDLFAKMSGASPSAVMQHLEEFNCERELEYAKYSGGYGDKSTQKGSVIWAIAKNIHDAAGLTVDDGEKTLVAIGDVVVVALASLDLENQLEYFYKNLKWK